MTGVYSELITVQSQPARVWRGGTGNRPLVLIHGGLGDAFTHWRWCWEKLADQYSIYAPDMPGFGGMTAPLREPTYQAFISWTSAMLDVFKLRQVALVGNSFGGTVARMLAAKQPSRVSHVVLANGGSVIAVTGVMRNLMNLPGFSDMMYGFALNSFDSPQFMDKLLADKGKITADLKAELSKGRDGFTAAMRQASRSEAPTERTPKCPVLVLWGMDDKLAASKTGQQIVKEIGNNATFRPIERAGHMPQLERPDDFVAAVRAFVPAG